MSSITTPKSDTAPTRGTHPAPRTMKRRPLRSYWREYLSIAPFYLLFAAFGLIPLGYAFYLATQKWDGLGPSTFVGFQQVTRLFTDHDFWTAVANTLIVFIFGMVPVVIAAVVAATILSRPGLRAKGFYQTLLFLPQVTSLVAVAVVFQTLFSDQFGIINHFLEMLGLGQPEWLTNPWLVKVVLAAMVFWRGLGYFMVIFLAGIAAIPTELYDAARVDGAGAIRSFVSVTLPMLRPTIVFVALTSTIAGVQLFTEPNVLFSGKTGPNNSGLTMMLLQVQYLGGGSSSRIPDLGYATVIGWAVVVILVGLALINRRVIRLVEQD